MADETEEDKARRLEKQVVTRDNTIATLKEGQAQLQKKADDLDKSIEQLEEAKGKAEKRVEQLEKKNQAGSGRMARVGSDLLGSSAAQAVNAAEQGLLNYLIDTFPDSIGKHKVLAKGLPAIVPIVWYLVEAYYANPARLAKWPTQFRMTAANLLANLNLYALAQTFWDERSDNNAKRDQLAQSAEESNAALQRVQADLAKATKLLKDKGVDFKSTANG